MKALSLAMPVAALAFAGCSGSSAYDPEATRESFEEMRGYIRKKVEDPARAHTVLGLVDRYESQVRRAQ